MYQIYSYIEADGKTFIPPEIKGEKASLPVYLMSINGRHYVSVDGQLPRQPPEIKLEGPINLKTPENTELAEKLAVGAEPNRDVRSFRSREYPDLRDQIGALMAEFQRRQDAGEKLSDELSSMLARISETKKKFPRKDKDLGL